MIKRFADHSANERTFLSWVRTAIAIVGLGLAAARLSDPQTGLWSELALLASGALVVGIAFLRMLSLKKQITQEVEFDDNSLPIDLTLIGLLAALLIMLATFGFHVS